MIQGFKVAIDRMQGIIDNVTPEQLTQSTPCAEFDVKGLLNHIIGGQHMLAGVANGEMPAGGDMPDFVGDNPQAAFKTAAAAAFAAWSQPDLMSKEVEFPFAKMPAPQGLGIVMMETFVHGWDLAKATGQDPTIDPQVAGMILAGMKAAPPSDDLRKPEAKVFGPEILVADDASPSDQLVAFLGRQP